MKCTIVFDCETEIVVAFWWSETMVQATEKQNEFRVQYPDAERYAINIEGEQASYNLDNACGY